MERFEYLTDIYSPMTNNVESGKLIYLNNWKVLPIKLIHNVECIGYVVVNTIENKKVVYITDTTYIPKLALSTIDCLILEVNYDENVVNEYIGEGHEVRSFGYLNHLELGQVKEYFINNGGKPKKLILSHLSNSGLIDESILLETMKPFAEEVYLANVKNLIVNV